MSLRESFQQFLAAARFNSCSNMSSSGGRHYSLRPPYGEWPVVHYSTYHTYQTFRLRIGSATVTYSESISNRYHPYNSGNRRYHAIRDKDNDWHDPSYTRMYDCYTCWKKFPSMADMWSHKHEAHKRTYYCRICNKDYPTLRSVKDHQRTHGNHSCQHCPETFQFKDSLTAHISEAHQQKKLLPIDAEKSVDKPGYFIAPVASSTPGRSDDQIQESENSNPKNESFQCYRCIKAFESADKLASHAKIHTNEEPDASQGQPPGILSCPFCIKRFENKRQLSLHMASAHTAVYYCAKCTAEFESQAELNAHSRNHVVLA